MTARFSLIINCLDSHEIVRRQALWLARLLPDDWEWILVDDGSDPALEVDWTGRAAFRLVQTHDTRPWTSPAARNRGFAHSTGSQLVWLDIDHVLTPEACEYVALRPQCARFPRYLGGLDEDGMLIRGGGELAAPPNIFSCRARVFVDAGRYDERFAGRYGGDDRDLFQRMRARPVTAPARVAVMSGPEWNHFFHRLPRR